MNIGRIVHVFDDSNRKDRFSDGETRSIVASVYYPAEDSEQENIQSSYLELFDPCVQEALRTLEGMGVDRNHFRNIRIPVQNNAEPNFANIDYPMVIYSPAFGVVRDMYIYHIQQLVDQGFIVVSVGAAYESIFTIFPDGRFLKQAEAISNIKGTDFPFWTEILETRVEDILYVIDHIKELTSRFKNKFNLGSISIVGHSLGGAAAFEIAKRNIGMKAAVLLDASFHLLDLDEYVKTETPFLVMRQEKCTFDELHDELSEDIIDPFVRGFEKLYSYLSGYKECVKVQGASHLTFSDVPMYYNETGISAKHKMISQYATAFLSEFVQGNALNSRRLRIDKYANDIIPIDYQGNPAKNRFH